VWRVQLAYALPFALAVGIEVVQATLPQYVVASRFDAATFAIFAVGCLQIPIVDVIATSSGNIMMVRLAGDTRGGLALWHDAISRLAFLIVPLTAFLIVAAEPVILTLFTARYLESAPIFALWTLTLLPAVFVVDSVLRAYAETRVLFLLNVFRLAIVAASIGAAVSAFGLIGAVVVTLAGTVLSRAIGLVRIARLLRVGAREVLPWGRLAIITAWTLVASISSAALVNHSAWPPLGRLMAGGLVFGAVYAAMCAGSVRLEQILSERPGLLRRGVSA
jgi:O-antigen/teichoic acid export membrane protein